MLLNGTQHYTPKSNNWRNARNTRNPPRKHQFKYAPKSLRSSSIVTRSIHNFNDVLFTTIAPPTLMAPHAAPQYSFHWGTKIILHAHMAMVQMLPIKMVIQTWVAHTTVPPDTQNTSRCDLMFGPKRTTLTTPWVCSIRSGFRCREHLEMSIQTDNSNLDQMCHQCCWNLQRYHTTPTPKKLNTLVDNNGPQSTGRKKTRTFAARPL